jgi:hypothetical protein
MFLPKTFAGKLNIAVHNTASPETPGTGESFNWLTVSQQLKGPLQLLSNFQSRPHDRARADEQQDHPDSRAVIILFTYFLASSNSVAQFLSK